MLARLPDLISNILGSFFGKNFLASQQKRNTCHTEVLESDNLVHIVIDWERHSLWIERRNFFAAMLRKNPAASAASSARSSRELKSFNSDDEKGSKMKRQKDSQSKAIFFCLGIIAFLGLIAKVEVNHLHRFTGKRLRRHSHHHSMERHMEEKGIKAQSAMDFVPPHSLYKLEVEDIHGKMVDFSMFRGMVTLIVNVACS